MNLFLVLTALFAILIIIYFSWKRKKIVQKIINKSLAKEEFIEEIKLQNFEKIAEVNEITEIAEELKKTSTVRPESNQQRNLDRETGGLEQADYREIDTKDPWEDRSDEIDREGSIDQLGSDSKKSMIWRKKKAKLDLEESIEAARDSQENNQGAGKSFDSRYGNQGGLNQILQARQDNSNSRGGGGMSL
jgi:hypothetical protein